MSELAQRRAKAWETRRAAYGPKGHSGGYARSRRERMALALIGRLHREGVLSEGQCCTALDMDRADFRAMCDALTYPAKTA